MSRQQMTCVWDNFQVSIFFFLHEAQELNSLLPGYPPRWPGEGDGLASGGHRETREGK